MILIHTETLNLYRFEEGEQPPYAILSHTWTDEEVTYADFISATGWRHLKGAYKILKTCEQARKHNLIYAWIDTCCIDKTSSAELTEGINSMYKWYQRAHYCYVYLSDYDSTQSQNFGHCRWFKRGWTLQELIAPLNLLHYDSKWRCFASGSEPETIAAVSKITGIQETLFLDQTRSLERFSVAERMSWASKRETRRKEDMAYCLLGIFGVNIPLLYGEGGKAFVRLQEAIIKENNDLSIFAWMATTNRYAGIIAPHPRFFNQAENVLSFSVPWVKTGDGFDSSEFYEVAPDNSVALKFEVTPKYDNEVNYGVTLSYGASPAWHVSPQHDIDMANRAYSEQTANRHYRANSRQAVDTENGVGSKREVSSMHEANPEFTITNKGLRIQTPLTEDQNGEGVVMLLNCHPRDDSTKIFGIFLRNLGGIYIRERANELAIFDSTKQTMNGRREQLLYIKKIQ